MRNSRLFKSVLSLVLVVAMVLGTVTTSYAEEVETTEVTVEEVFEAIENVEEKVDDVIASLPYGGDISEATEEVIITVAGEEKIVGVIEEAEKVIENEALLDSEETDAATSEMDKAEEKIEEIKDAVAGMEDTYGEADEMEFVSSEDAKTAVDELTKAEEDAKAAYTVAEEALEAAKGNLDEAQAEYEAAKAFSEEAAAEAAAKLEAAKAELARLEEVAKATNDSVKEAQDLLNEVADKVADAENKSDVALEEAQNKLEESKETLDSAIENVETESAEFNAAIDDFKEKYDAFVEKANNFYEAIEEAQATEEELEALYAEYEAAQEALEVAKAAYAEEQAKCEELGYEFEEDYFANFEKYISELETAMGKAETAMNDAETAKNNAEEAKKAYETEEAKAYESALNGYRDTLKSEEATQEDKDVAAKEAAKLVIEKELAAGQTVTWIPAGESEYGKSATGFYVVLDAEGNLVERYGYVLDSASVDIYQMKSDEVVNYVEYNGQKYALEGNTITVDGQTITVNTDTVEGNYVYYVKDAAETAEVPNTDEDPNKLLAVPALGDYTGLDIEKDENGQLYIDIPVIGKCYLEETSENTYELIYTSLECTKNHTCSWKVWECSVSTVEKRLAVTVSFPNKTQIVYGDGQYDILTEGETKYIIVNGEKITVYEDNGVYTTRNNTTYVPGGTADTTFEIGSATNKNSNTYADAKNEVVNNYNSKLEIYNGKVTDYNNAVSDFNTSNSVFEGLVEAQESVNNTAEEADAKDIGAMADLPKNIGEMVDGLDAEQVETLLTAVVELSTSGENVDYKAVLDVLSNVTGTEAAARLMVVMGYDAAGDTLDSIIGGLGSIFGDKFEETVDAPSEFEREYANAWVDALMAKINVVKTAVEVVEATSETITAGLTVINTGADLGDAAIDALIAKVEEAILNGSVETLAVAADILEVSDRIVSALADKINALASETQEAYDAVVEAQEALDALELTNPKAEELAKAEQTLADATARYEALTETLESAKADLATAENYKNAAQAQYDALTTPAEEDTPILPTPGVDAPVEEEEDDEEVVTPVVPSTPSIEDVIEATTTATTTTTTAPVEIEDEETPLAGGEVEGETIVIEDEETPLASGDVEIEDEETPLAAAEETTSNVVVPVAVATGSVSILALLWFFLRKKVAA